MRQRDDAARAYDRALGHVLRQRRRHLHLSLDAVGSSLGVTWAAIQQYETGRNRIAVSRLALVAAALRTTPQSLIVETGRTLRRNPDA